MKQDFYLMNKNDKLLSFTVEETPLGEMIRETASFSKVRPQGFKDIATFITQRNFAKHKEHFKKWLKEWGIDNTIGFCDVTHGLSLNDALWITDINSSLTWEMVNLYNNEFNDIAQKTAFETGLFGLQLSSTSPEFTSEGNFPKCWERENGKIYLYKGGLTGASNVGLEPYSEYISSRFLSDIYSNVIKYDLVTMKDTLCSKCSLFTDENIGFIPFYKFVEQSKAYNINDVINVMSDLGYENAAKKMFFVDSLVFNQDRHLGNFGFLIDNDSFEILSFAPLFDFNLSFLCNALETDLDDFEKYEDTYILGHKLGGKFSDVGKALLTDELISNLPKTITFPKHDKYNLPQERINKLSGIFENNIKNITGKSFYSVFDNAKHIYQV